MSPSAEPPPGPDPRRVLREHEELSPRSPSGAAPPDGSRQRERIALIALAALALGLGASTAVLAAAGPREEVITETTVSTERLRPTTTTVVTEVLTTTTNTRTTTETTETVTETVTEGIPPGLDERGPQGPDGRGDGQD